MALGYFLPSFAFRKINWADLDGCKHCQVSFGMVLSIFPRLYLILYYSREKNEDEKPQKGEKMKKDVKSSYNLNKKLTRFGINYSLGVKLITFVPYRFKQRV